MSPTEAVMICDRIDLRWSVSTRQLLDAECMLSDMLERVKRHRLDRRKVQDMLNAQCRVSHAGGSRQADATASAPGTR